MKMTSSKLTKSLALTLGIFMAAASVAIAPVVAEAQQAKKGNKGKKAGKRDGGKLTPAQRAARKAKRAAAKKANKTKAKKKVAKKPGKTKTKKVAKKRKVAKKKVVVTRKVLRNYPDTSVFMKRLYGNYVSGPKYYARPSTSQRVIVTKERIIRSKPSVTKKINKKIKSKRNAKIRRGNGRLRSFDDIRGSKKYRGGRYGDGRKRNSKAKLQRQILKALDRWF
ncbi:MAG: hypothetical protein ACRBCJ_00510 [Hyphomicrobiaceae bacterium]